MLKIALMMNNYFHDFATALLVTSGVIIYVLLRQAEKTDSAEVIDYFIRSYRKLTLLGRVSFMWIILAGTIRLINFRSFEWFDAVGKDQVPSLITKHMIMFFLVGLGIYYWRKLNKKILSLEKNNEVDVSQGKPTQLIGEGS